VLYGRDAERLALADLLDGARASRSGVLLLVGEAGIGKSALLADTVADAIDMRLVRAAGVESESELPYAGLHQLLRPLQGMLGDIPPPQADALGAALGLRTGAPADRFLVSAAALSLLAAAAEERPLLCVVDDAHWLDRPSADALAFVGRRLQAEPLALLMAARDGRLDAFAGLPELRIEGVSGPAADALLAASGGLQLPAEVRARLVEVTHGNPLALMEMPRALSREQLAGRSPIADPPPLTPRLERVFVDRVRRLPDESRLLLLVAAADDTGETRVVLEAAAALGAVAGDLQAAEEAGLLTVEPDRVVFRHPLVRSAVYQGAGFAQRQAVHRALADVHADDGDADRRTWHLAAAASGPDAGVAEALEASADRARGRGALAAAASALERAAELTADEEPRAARLAKAGSAAWLAGLLPRAVALLEAARRLTADPVLRADIDHSRALIELQSGLPATAHRILLEAGAEIAPIDPRRAVAMLVSSGEAAGYGGMRAEEISAGRRAARLGAGRPGTAFELAMLDGVGAWLSHDFEAAVPKLRSALAAAEASDNPRRHYFAGVASLYLLDEGTARAFLARAAEELRALGAISMLTIALQVLAFAEMLEGRIASAAAHANEALQLALETGQENGACQARAVLAWTDAIFGRAEDCRAHAAEVFALASVRGLGMQSGIATWALGELELGARDAEAALVQFVRLARHEPGRSHASFGLATSPQLIEAAVRAGRPEAAGLAGLEAFERAARCADAEAALAMAARARALLADGEEAVAGFEAAIAHHAASPRPFETARTRLLYGETLRRGRQRRAAREHLEAALDAFEQLGAAGWAARARAELRASGRSARRREPGTVDRLTPQELQIARLVAGGSSNRDVAAHLYLSPRTVDFHLRNVFAKLGIASRHELGGFGLADEQWEVRPPQPVAG